MPDAASSSSRSLAGRSHERPAREILLVPRLLADQHQAGLRRAFSRHGLGGEAVQRAALAGRQFRPERLCRMLVGR
jgi:hypothetical protein